MDQTGVRFGRFEWRPDRRQLLQDGKPVALGSRALELLAVLAAQPGGLVSKEQLLQQAWPGLVVDDSNLPVQVAALRRVLGDDAIATVQGRGYRWMLTPEAGEPGGVAPEGSPHRARPSLAVLPFTNASGTPEDDYLADGLAEDVAAGLSRSRWLMVVASSSSFQFRDQGQPVQDVGRRLGAQYLVRGTLRRAGQRLRLTVELLQAADADVVWAERYDRPTEDLFALQDDICKHVVGTMEPALLKQEERRAAAQSDRDLQHWDLVARARWHYWRSSQRHSNECRRLLEQALARRPDDVSSLALLAFTLATEIWSGWAADAKTSALQARRLATRAVALDDMDAFAHFSLGVTLLGFGEIDAAMACQRRALALHPHFAAAAAELGRLAIFSGQTDEGRGLTLQAMQASPTDPRMALWVFALGIGSFVDGKPADAAQHARQAIALRRDWFFNHLLLAVALDGLGDAGAAAAALAEGLRLLPTLNLTALRFGHPFRDAALFERYVKGLRSAGWQG